MSANTPSFTPADVAQRFGVSLATVAAWIRAGELLAVNVSRSPRSKKPRWRIAPIALEAFEARRAGGAPVETKPRRRNRPEGVIQFYA